MVRKTAVSERLPEERNERHQGASTSPETEQEHAKPKARTAKDIRQNFERVMDTTERSLNLPNRRKGP